MRFDVRYTCRFSYEDLVRESQNELRACPTTDAGQQLVSYKVTTIPSSRVHSYTDYWGTRVDAFGVREPHLVFDVVAEATVETKPRSLLTINPPAATLTGPDFLDEYGEFLDRSPHADWGAEVAAEAASQCSLAGAGVVSQVLGVHRWVAGMEYQPGSTYVGVDVNEVFRQRSGVCQDFAHLAVAMCRSVGIPARYVSGYLFTTNDATGADAAGDAVRVQTHAWFEAAVPGHGWVALDPTNGQEVGLRHVTIGRGRDYDDVLPLRGVYAGQVVPHMEVSVEMRRTTTATAVPAEAARRVATITPAPPPPPPPDPHKLQQQQQQQQQ